MAVDYTDIIGTEYPGSRLTPLERGPDYIAPGDPYGRRTVQYWCSCSCEEATRKLIRRDSLLKGATKSCGCISRENRKRLGNRWTSSSKRRNIAQTIQAGHANDF